MGKFWGTIVAVVAQRGVVKRARSFCRRKCQKAARSAIATGAPVDTTDALTTNTKGANGSRAPNGVQVSPSIPIPSISSRRNQHIILPPARPALVWPDDLILTSGLSTFRRDNFLPSSKGQNGPTNSLPPDGSCALFGSPGRRPQKEQEEGPTSTDEQMEHNHDSSTASPTPLFNDLLHRVTEVPHWLQNNQPRVFRHSHGHTSLTTRKPTLGKMVGSTYIRKTPRPPFTQAVSDTASSSSALASLIRPSAGSSRTTMDISEKDRNRNRNSNQDQDQDQDDHDGYDDNEVAVESCSPNLGFAKMQFIAHRKGPVRQGPSYPGCPSPPLQFSQSLIDAVAAANNDVYADSSDLRYAREENTRATKQERPHRDIHFYVPESDESPTEEAMTLAEWNRYNEVAIESCSLSLETARDDPLAMCTVVEPPQNYRFAYRLRAYYDDYISQVALNARTLGEAERRSYASRDDEYHYDYDYWLPPASRGLTTREEFYAITNGGYGSDPGHITRRNAAYQEDDDRDYEEEEDSMEELSPGGLGFVENDHPSERFCSSGRDAYSHPHAHYLDASPAEEMSVRSEEFYDNDEDRDNDILNSAVGEVAPSPWIAQCSPVQRTAPVQAFCHTDLYHPRPDARQVNESVVETLTAAAECYEEAAEIRLRHSESPSLENPEKWLSRSLIEAMEAAAEY